MGHHLGKPQDPLVQLQSRFGSDMVMFHLPCQLFLDPFLNQCASCCQTLEMGPSGDRVLAKVRVRSSDVATAEEAPVSCSHWRAQLSAHASVRVKYSLRVRDRVRGRLRFTIRVTIRVRVRSQQVHALNAHQSNCLHEGLSGGHKGRVREGAGQD